MKKQSKVNWNVVVERIAWKVTFARFTLSLGSVARAKKALKQAEAIYDRAAARDLKADS